MSVFTVIVTSAVLLLLGYRYYGDYISRMIGLDPERPTPAIEMEDGRDYVPTPCSVVFSHHYASIAGAGPIVGPTIAIVFGVVPALLWAVFGGILMGAVHDFTAMFVSLRERGKSIAETIRRIMGPVGFYLFTGFLLVMLVLVTAAFLTLSAKALTSQYPLSDFGLQPGQTLLPVVPDHPEMAQIGGIASSSLIIITLIAPMLGYLLHTNRLQSRQAWPIAFVVIVASVVVGLHYPLRLDPKTWMVALTIYTFLAAGIPVWVLLQPRDFVNVLLLYIGMGLLFIASIGAGLRGAHFQAPALDLATGSAKLGAIWPVLFITIACGAISGFHALVSGGTSCKQLKTEADAKRVGYGAMLLESMLAVTVIIAVGYGLRQDQYMGLIFPVAGKGNPVLAFALGVGAVLRAGLGIPSALGTVIGILMIEGFLVTTLDTAIRLNRYVFEELWEGLFGRKVPVLSAFWFNSGLSCVLMLAFAWTNKFLRLWPLFGTGNQLLAALTLIGVSAWLVKHRRPYWFTLGPAVLMLVTTAASLITLLKKFIADGNTSLMITDVILLVLSGALVVLAVRVFMQPAETAEPAVAAAGGGSTAS